MIFLCSLESFISQSLQDGKKLSTNTKIIVLKGKAINVMRSSNTYCLECSIALLTAEENITLAILSQLAGWLLTVPFL